MYNIQEYRNINYVMSINGGVYALEYALNGKIESGFDNAIIENNVFEGNALYFVGVISPEFPLEIINRGFIKSGDQFIVSPVYPKVVYLGDDRIIPTDSFLGTTYKQCWGIGFSIINSEGLVIITELILNSEELKEFNSELRINYELGTPLPVFFDLK